MILGKPKRAKKLARAIPTILKTVAASTSICGKNDTPNKIRKRTIAPIRLKQPKTIHKMPMIFT
jgi:hypothetical protein